MKVAVIGCGRMGAFTTDKTKKSIPSIWNPLSHIDAINMINGLELVAICDVLESQLEKVLAICPSVKTYTDYNKMLMEVKVDIVGIATRTEDRFKIISACAKAGVKAIHAEKPLARSLRENEIALDALRSHKVGFTFGAVRRYMAPYQLAKKIAYSGEIGSIRQVVIEHGSDMLLWGHSHTIDLAMYICDGARVDRVQGRLRISPQDVKKNVVNSDPVLDMAYLEFNNGISTIITAGSGFCLRIYGETGSVTVIGDGSKVELRKKKKNSPYELNCQDIEFNSSISGTQQAFINLMKYVQSGKKTGLSLSEVKRVHQTLFALALSELNNGEAINPNNVPYDFIITGRFGNLYA